MLANCYRFCIPLSFSLLLVWPVLISSGFRAVKRTEMTPIVTHNSALLSEETHIELNRTSHIDADGLATSGSFLFITKRDESGNEYMLIRVIDPEPYKGESVLVHLDSNARIPNCYLYHKEKDYLEKIQRRQIQTYFSLSRWAIEDLFTPADSDLILKPEFDDTVDQELCSVIRMEYRDPLLRKHSGYGFRKVWISKRNKIPLKTVYYNKQGELIKTSILKDYRQVGHQTDSPQLPHRIQMTHHQDHTIDVITTIKMVSNLTLPDRIFNPDYLKLWNDQDDQELLAMLEEASN